MRIKFLLLLLVIFQATAPVYSQAISPLMYGQNAWMPAQIGERVFYGKLGEHWGKLSDCGLRFIRVGGIGYDQNQLTNTQLIAVIDSIRKIGAEPLIQVPYNNGSFNETAAAAMVKYVNVTLQKGVKYWSVGNEPNQGYSITTAAPIAEYYRRFATAMKKEDSSIKIVGPDLAGMSESIYSSLIGGVDDITGKDANGNYILDVVSYHFYYGNGTHTRSNIINEAPTRFRTNAENILSWINSANTKNGRTGTNVLTWAATEFNIDYKNPTTNDVAGVGVQSFLNGQYWVECFGIAMEYGALSVMPWSVHESAGAGTTYDLGFLNGADGKIPRSSYYHMQFMTRENKANFTTSTDNQSLVKVVSTIDNTGTTVLIMNQDLTSSFGYTVALNTNTVSSSSPLIINVNKGQNIQYTSPTVIPAQSTHVLVFNSLGKISKIIEYTINDAENQTAPRVLFDDSLPLIIANFEGNGSDKLCDGRFTQVTGGSLINIVDNPYTSGNNTSAKTLKLSDIVLSGSFVINLTNNITNTDDKITNGTDYTGLRFKYKVNNPSNFPLKNAVIKLNGVEAFSANGQWSNLDSLWQTVTFLFDSIPASIYSIQVTPYKQWTPSGSPISGLEIYLDDIELFKDDDLKDQQLKMITVDGNSLEFFDPETTNYTYYLPYTHSTVDIPNINYNFMVSGQSVNIIQATNLLGNVQERTTQLIVRKNSQEQRRYNITFEILPQLDIYLCLGQSNMSGYGPITEADMGVLSNTYLLTPQMRFETAENPLNKYSTISNGTNTQLGPPFGFAKELVDKSIKPIGLLVNARNGSAIEWWRKGNTTYNLYDNTIERALEAKKWGEIKAILWHQGESDSWQATAYQDLLKTLVGNFRADLGDINNDIYFIAGELAYWRHDVNGVSTSESFNNMIRNISTFIPNSDYVSADGLTPVKDDTDPHFDRASVIILGQRYADKIIKKYYKSTEIRNAKSIKKKTLFLKKGSTIIINGSTDNESEVLMYDVTGKLLLEKKFIGEISFDSPIRGIAILIIKNNINSDLEKIRVDNN